MNRFAEAMEAARVDVVPKVVIGGDGGHANGDGLGGGNNVLQALLALLLSERMGVDVAPTSPPSAEAQSMREQLRTQISSTAPARS